MAPIRRGRRAAEGTDERTSGSTAAAGVGAGIYGVLGVLAVLVDVITGIVAVIIALGIIFVVLKANPGNTIVSGVHDAAKFLVGPFDGMFKPKDHRLEIAINWGIALAVYVVVGRAIAGFLRRRRA